MCFKRLSIWQMVIEIMPLKTSLFSEFQENTSQVRQSGWSRHFKITKIVFCAQDNPWGNFSADQRGPVISTRWVGVISLTQFRNLRHHITKKYLTRSSFFGETRTATLFTMKPKHLTTKSDPLISANQYSTQHWWHQTKGTVTSSLRWRERHCWNRNCASVHCMMSLSLSKHIAHIDCISSWMEERTKHTLGEINVIAE